MPDPGAFGRGAMLPHLANPKGRGGIVKYSPNYKGFSVEIRPPRWEKKIWIGKLETLELAQYVADAVRYYFGMLPYFSEEGLKTLPAITCIGTVIGTPVKLSTQEMRVSYVREIAKGEAFKPQREDFILKVKNVVKNPDFPFLASSDDDDEFVYDEDAEMALQMSSHSGSSDVPVAVHQTHVAGPDSGGGSEGVQAYIPSFRLDSYGSENILRSAGQSFNAIVVNLDDCPTTSSDEKVWIESIEELDKRTAAGASTPSVASSDDGYETSPILSIPPILRPCALTSSKIFGDLVELAVPARSALGSSSDWPSVEFAVNAKIRRIGD